MSISRRCAGCVPIKPAVPAAVPVYDTTTGTTRVLIVDLDTSRGGQDVVRRDASTIADLVHAAGGRVITDESPTGGIHVYIPLVQAVPFHDARDVALALARRLPSMDPSPNQNLQAGLIRPPRSKHRAGGYQRLHGPLSAAVATARAGNSHAVWLGLTAALASELAALTPPTPGSTGTTDVDDTAPHRPRLHGPRDLARDYLSIARTGIWPLDRYNSPSEARMAVMTAAAWAGHTLTDVITRLHTGAWPGLASLYARYRTRTRTKAIRNDWIKAHQLIAKQTNSPETTSTPSLVIRGDHELVVA